MKGTIAELLDSKNVSNNAKAKVLAQVALEQEEALSAQVYATLALTFATLAQKGAD